MGYVFDPEVLGELAKLGVDKPPEQAFDAITAGLAERYPGHIYDGPRRWVMNNAGGAMGQLTLLHASLKEYLILFGTPIGTEGHSGRYPTDVYDWVFHGEMWTYIEGESDRTVNLPGTTAYLPADKVKGYRIPEKAWMLEYARGFIPSMLPFGLADTMLSTLDLKCFARTVTHYGQLTATELLGDLERKLPGGAKALPLSLKGLLSP